MASEKTTTQSARPVARSPVTDREVVVLEREGLQALIETLARQGHRVLGPTLRDKAIQIADIAGIDDLPEGWTAEQSGGHYRLKRRKDRALFGHAVGQQSWKPFLFPPVRSLWRAERSEDGFTILAEEARPRQFAFLGVRPCDLAAIAIQDRVFLQGPYVDAVYTKRRQHTVLIAVNCTEPGGTCFCASMGTGPEATSGYDLALTEVTADDGSFLVTRAGTDKGKALLREIPHKVHAEEVIALATRQLQTARQRMGRSLETKGIRDLFHRNLEHPRWEQTARRCLTCANCTLVCPTCFCHTVEDSTNLDGTRAERSRKWDSCYSVEFSYVAGGSIRTSAMARYRQWITHKLANWIDQFGVPGCVGCGRCITWCPVGIDITEEATAIRQGELAARTGGTRGKPNHA